MYPEEAEEGGFAAYGPSERQLFLEIVPEQIIKLFRGTKVADIPVEQATKFDLVINLKTAKAMGVTVPRRVIVRRRQGDRMNRREGPRRLVARGHERERAGATGGEDQGLPHRVRRPADGGG